jgi:hypothetical protein
VDSATGTAVSVNSQRGDPFVLLDKRPTKFFTLGATNGRIGVFAQSFNTTKLGQSYQGNSRSSLFKQQPIGFIPGVGYPFQLQLGARLEFSPIRG